MCQAYICFALAEAGIEMADDGEMLLKNRHSGR